MTHRVGTPEWSLAYAAYVTRNESLMVDLMTKVTIAYIKDRAEQYDNGSGIFAAFEELLQQFRDDEHIKAFRHGELDDLLRQMGPRENETKEEDIPW